MRKTRTSLTRPEYDIIAVSGGITYDLNDLCDYAVVDVDGLGIPEQNRFFQRIPLVDGDLDLGYYLNPREIVLTMYSTANDNYEYYVLREKLQGVFRPRTFDPVQLIFTLPNIRVAADVNMIGNLAMPFSDRLDHNVHRVGVALKASDPRLYDPAQKSAQLRPLNVDLPWEIEETGQTTSDGWMIEETGQNTADGWPLGAGPDESFLTIAYAGLRVTGADEYPTITIVGPITNPVIQNITTNEKLDFTGLTIDPGKFITITLNPYLGKTVLDQSGVNLDGALSIDSDLATFHIAYNTKLLSDGSICDGNNTFRLTGSNVTTATLVEFVYYDRYVGV